MANFCGFGYLENISLSLLLFMLLMLTQAPTFDTRPAPDRHSDLIAGNEFLKLFLDHDELQRSLHSNEYMGRGGSRQEEETTTVRPAPAVLPLRSSSARGTSARSLEHKSHYRNLNSHIEDDGKQLVKLVTSGSKIVFLEEYDDDELIDLKKVLTKHKSPSLPPPQLNDDVQVLAVSVSSSSKRGGGNNIIAVSKQHTTSTTRRPSDLVDFINRSHKSELSIEEAEPLTMLQHGKRNGDTLDESDSVNSASTNIQNVLAAPLISAASSHSSASVAAVHLGSKRNATSQSLMQSAPLLPPPHDVIGVMQDKLMDEQSETDSGDDAAISMDDKLLPFQTVIYHNSKQGHHGPQSRSISYSSISQNVEDLATWHKGAAGGILAEAQRNVSESLKPLRTASEPAKFYSVPSKFYSEPSKVYSQPSKYYSEPAKVYSQPSKVYGEPAKTYWPQSLTTSTTTTTSAPKVASAAGSSTFVPSRRPAIVSRIAFGEAQTTSTTTTTSTMATTSSKPPLPTATSGTFRPTTWQHQTHHYNHNSNSNNEHQTNPSHQLYHGVANSQPRRVLFNLDKLPYDLLNAPQPQSPSLSSSSRHLLEPILLKRPISETATESQLNTRHHQQQQQQPNPCWEPTSSSSSSSTSSSALSTSQHQHQRQHSSLSVQHSNQNAKGLPNRDLVRCVSKYAHSMSGAGSVSTSYSATSQHHYTTTTTERSRFDDELYTPTPEQNYEIEESVSVMTNGRAHGIQGNGGIGPALAALTTTTPTIPTATQQRNRNRFDGNTRSRGSVTYNANANANDYGDTGDDSGGGGGDDGEQDYNTPSEDAAQQNDDGQGSDGGGGGGGGGNDDDDDDSKVAAYVVEGRNYRKYRVEEKTDDGFIVGEYGVVDHNDGNLRGVRYTADSTINRSLIQKALLTFLKLK